MSDVDVALEDLIAEVVHRADGETTRYVAEKARALLRTAQAEALREAGERVRQAADECERCGLMLDESSLRMLAEEVSRG